MFLMQAKHYEGHIQGWALKIESFCGPEMALAMLLHFRAQKTLNFQGPTLNMAQVM